MFDRINRNVARLQRQELRHARFGGVFASSVERLNDLLVDNFGLDVPRIASSSRRQMKDVELVAQLLLLVENGPQSFSQDELDEAYSSRDEEWEAGASVENTFREVIGLLREVFERPDLSSVPMRRLKNQADFYSLFGAYVALLKQGAVPDADEAAGRLASFIADVAEETERPSRALAEDTIPPPDLHPMICDSDWLGLRYWRAFCRLRLLTRHGRPLGDSSGLSELGNRNLGRCSTRRRLHQYPGATVGTISIDLE